MVSGDDDSSVADVILDEMKNFQDLLEVFIANIYNKLLSFDSFDQLLGSLFFWLAGISKDLFMETISSGWRKQKYLKWISNQKLWKYWY